MQYGDACRGFTLGAAEVDAVPPDRVYVLRPRIDKHNVAAGLGDPTTDVGTHRARPYKCDTRPLAVLLVHPSLPESPVIQPRLDGKRDIHHFATCSIHRSFRYAPTTCNPIGIPCEYARYLPQGQVRQIVRPSTRVFTIASECSVCQLQVTTLGQIESARADASWSRQRRSRPRGPAGRGRQFRRTRTLFASMSAS